MGLVHITSSYPNFNGSHFGLPPSPSTKWLDWVAKWCELWHSCTDPIQVGVFIQVWKSRKNVRPNTVQKHNGNVDRLIIIQWPWKRVQLDSHLDRLQFDTLIEIWKNHVNAQYISKTSCSGIQSINMLSQCRAATNVRTFEYYSFEIFTNELFLRTNVRPLVCFWRTHCGAQLRLRPRACMGAMHEWRNSCNLALTLVNVMSRRSAEKEAVTWTFNLKRSMKDNPSKVSNT